MASSLCLRVEVPICAFRPYASREYQDTYPVPPPSAVYGMLLSLVGVQREDKSRHRGVELALAVDRLPERSKVFRKLRRGKDLASLRPDYQDILVDLGLWCWLGTGADAASTPLPERVRTALRTPQEIHRSGGLSLGESSYLVDSVWDSKVPSGELVFLKPDKRGFHSLPVWVDHGDRKKTVVERFSLETLSVEEGLRTCWVRIGDEC